MSLTRRSFVSGMAAALGYMGVRPAGLLAQACRQRVCNNQRVVAGGVKRIGDALKQGNATVMDGGGLTVHQRWRPLNASAEDYPNGLMTEADAQRRDCRP